MSVTLKTRCFFKKNATCMQCIMPQTQVQKDWVPTMLLHNRWSFWRGHICHWPKPKLSLCVFNICDTGHYCSSKYVISMKQIQRRWPGRHRTTLSRWRGTARSFLGGLSILRARRATCEGVRSAALWQDRTAGRAVGLPLRLLLDRPQTIHCGINIGDG